jgi:hypothetical protein
MGDAQLGSVGNFNLGGYVPAPVKQNPLWKTALAQILTNAGEQAVSAGVQNVTAADPNDPNGHGLHRAWTPTETADSQYKAGQVKVAKDTQAETAAYHTREGDLKQGEIAASIARDKDAHDIASGHLEVARQAVINAKTDADRAAALQAYHVALQIYGVPAAQAREAAQTRQADAMGRYYDGAASTLAGAKANQINSKAQTEAELLKFFGQPHSLLQDGQDQ